MIFNNMINTNKYILMYHSINGDKQKAVVGSFPIEMERFIFQVQSLKKYNYIFDYISNLNKQYSDNLNRIYITGDDGTIDWTKNVLPWCEQNKIPTHTAIITGPFETVPIYPITHLIQIILILRSEQQLLDLSNTLKKYLAKSELKYIEKIYFYENLEYRKIIKGACNLILNKKEIYHFIGNLSKLEKDLLIQRFEKLEYYKNFNYAEIGVHTKSHWALGKNYSEYITEEIETSRELLLKNGLNPTKYFVSPMKPRDGASLFDIKDNLKNLGYDGILDSNHGIWNQKDFIIPRIDAKNIEDFFKL